VLRDTTSRGLYVRVWPPHTSERRGGGGGCEQEGWQGGVDLKGMELSIIPGIPAIRVHMILCHDSLS